MSALPTLALAAVRVGLEPHIGNAAIIFREVVKAMKPVKMLDRQGFDIFWRTDHTQICRNFDPPFIVRPERLVISKASACRAEMERYTITSRISCIGAVNGDDFGFPTINP